MNWMLRTAAVISMYAALSAAPAVATQPAVPAAEPKTACSPPDRAALAALKEIRRSMMEPGTKIDLAQLFANPALVALRQAETERLKSDWAYLCRFKHANDALASAPPPDAVFIGDSITENWSDGDPSMFDARHVNRGIGGQTSSQLLVRFMADVVALRPRAVHIMIGTNDIAGNTGPASDETFENNVRAMVAIARAHNIRVILAAIPPMATIAWAPDLKPIRRVKLLNGWLEKYAQTTNAVFVDYGPVLGDGAGALKLDLGNDGVHPNRNGYAVMAPLARLAMTRALAATG